MGGVGLTMTNVREGHWVPRLRRLVKRVVKNCYWCNRFQATALSKPPPGNLPKDRTEGTAAFQVVGVDFAGPLKYRKGKKNEAKAYIVLYACSLTRGIYLELLLNMETKEFMSNLKRFIARRGRPETFYSDSGRTFIGTARLLRTIKATEDHHERRGVSRLPGAQRNQVEVQFKSSSLVGWTIRAVNWTG